MQASSRPPEGARGGACERCSTTHGPGARFCKQCGAALLAPPECPTCRAPVPSDARFCSSCGAKLVGARPMRASVTEERAPSPRGNEPASPAAEGEAVRQQVEKLVESMPRPARGRSSNIVGNVLLFFAALSIFVVVMYTVNKDAPKSTSPFSGPPPAARPEPRAAGSETPAPQAGLTPPDPAAGGGAPISGVVRIASDLASSAPSSGTVFVIVRMAGMPDRGPPVAVKKFSQPSFPLSFEIGPDDVMMQGMPFSGPFDLYARLDADGNAMTKAPGDLQLSLPKSGVTPGSSGVEIVLDKRL